MWFHVKMTGREESKYKTGNAVGHGRNNSGWIQFSSCKIRSGPSSLFVTRCPRRSAGDFGGPVGVLCQLYGGPSAERAHRRGLVRGVRADAARQLCPGRRRRQARRRPRRTRQRVGERLPALVSHHPDRADGTRRRSDATPTSISDACRCSGRTCCEGVLFELRLAKRQDLLSVLLSPLRPVQDQVHVRVLCNHDDMDT